MSQNIFLTGFSGTGKTTVGQEIARTLGWTFIDTDAQVVRVAGKPITEIFAEDGEKCFRNFESNILASICENSHQVVSTGGGIVKRKTNQTLMHENGVVICLEAKPETIYQRLLKQNTDLETAEIRPLLAGADPVKHIMNLKATRQRYYAQANWTVHTDQFSPQLVATEILRARQLLIEDSSNKAEFAAIVRTEAGSYPVYVGWDLLKQFGHRSNELLAPGAAYFVTDDGAYTYARKVQASMEAVGVPSHFFVAERGEQHKTLDTIRHIYNWLASLRAERRHLVIAVGGGVIGDLAGFAAATYLRGMPFAQVPTTLLAMMDSSIGGKTGVDLTQGKNLIGAFHHPKLVVSDIKTLESLPPRVARAGWAEAIKHALIMDEQLLNTFETHARSILTLDQEIATNVIRKSIRIKGNVVSQDQRETLGLRILLNYGHTIGHAIEAATDYTQYLHGEAVSVGMMAAAFISHDLGMLSSKDLERQKAVLRTYGLPTSVPATDAQALYEAMKLDKKVVGGRNRWVLLEGLGHATVRDDVPDKVVEKAIMEISTGK